MHAIDVSKFDLNLLVALDALLQERHVTRAARRLHLTQSATSHTLARLRDQLEDPLLIRSGREMKLTPKGVTLSLELPKILRSIERVLGAEDSFDAATSERVFLLGAPDFVSAVLPAVLQGLRLRAPRTGVEFVVTDEWIDRELTEGRLDIAIGSPLRRQIEDVISEPLPDLRWVVFARRGHPATRAWSREAWERWPHVRVRRGRDRESDVDRLAREKKVKRRMGAIVPQFMHAAPLLAATDMLMATPHVVFASLASQFDLVALESPVAIDPVHPRIHLRGELSRDPALSILNDVVRSAFLDLVAAAARMPVVPLRRRHRV